VTDITNESAHWCDHSSGTRFRGCQEEKTMAVSLGLLGFVVTNAFRTNERNHELALTRDRLASLTARKQRFNVAVSRARDRVILVQFEEKSSIQTI
jgi:hypothetical protein